MRVVDIELGIEDFKAICLGECRVGHFSAGFGISTVTRS